MTAATHLALNQTFSAVRVLNYRLSPVTFSVKLCCVPVSDSEQSLEHNSHRAAVAFQLLQFWMREMLDGIVIVDPLSEMGEQMIYTCDNRLLFTPGSADDFTLVRLLHSKCSAIADHYIHIESLTLTSSDTFHSERYWSGDRYALPGADYLKQPMVHALPWWQRRSIDICDYLTKDLEAHGESIEDIVNLSDPLIELENQLTQDIREHTPAEIIEDIWKS